MAPSHTVAHATDHIGVRGVLEGSVQRTDLSHDNFELTERKFVVRNSLFFICSHLSNCY